ncbi:MAG: orotate phosphoribosyltransferase [Rickettsiales bacterium]|jgi:orotate phosphoribosyltransferase|nr:orotate phosphoribosyltransferase [Rickettsiales bacterium]
MVSNTDYLEILKESKAILKGHFILSSGLHSDTYIQCAQIFTNPKLAETLCNDLAKKIKAQITTPIDYVVAPAMGGVIIGYEIARQLGVKSIFCERVDGVFEFRRGFNLNPSDNVLIVEDVITTGKSSLETVSAINKYGATILAEACMIDRRPIKEALDNISIISLIELNVETFDENNTPNKLQNIPAIKPGSRFLKT